MGFDSAEVSIDQDFGGDFGVLGRDAEVDENGGGEGAQVFGAEA